MTSVATSSIAFSLLSSLAGVLLFNFLFTVPRFSLTAYGTGYPVTFLIMFITAGVSGLLAQRYRSQASGSHKTAHRLKLLLDTNKLLLSETDGDKILTLAAGQLKKLFKADVIIFDADMNVKYFPADTTKPAVYDLETERKSAEFVINGSQAPAEKAEAKPKFFYLPLRVEDKCFGAIGIPDDALGAFDRDTFMSVALECALALANEQNRREKEKVAIVASNEQLRANILRSISHDLRTPLTSISGGAANLLENGDKLDEETRKSLLRDIVKESERLSELVENVLASTRMEDGEFKLRLSDELIGDIADAAVNYCSKRTEGRSLSLVSDEGMCFVSADAKLIVQVIVNLIDNAIKYTPAGSHIEVRVEDVGNNVRVSVADDGYGVAEEDKPHIFEKFFRGTNGISDSRRSLGLGLYLCKAIIEAHGGAIRLEDNVPHGAKFVFELAKKEIKINE